MTDHVRAPATCCATRVRRRRLRPRPLPQRRHLLHRADVRDALHARLAERAAPRRLPDGRLHRARRRRRRRSASRPLPPSSTGRPDGHLRVPADVPRREPRAPPGAEPRRRAHRGAARRPRHDRRDLPHRPLAEGHERDDGLRRGSRRSPTRWRTSSSCCASGAGGLAARRRSTSCWRASTRSRRPSTRIEAGGRLRSLDPAPTRRTAPRWRSCRARPRRARARSARARRRRPGRGRADAGRPGVHGARRRRRARRARALRADAERVDGFAGTHVEVWVATDARGRAARGALRAVPDVAP